MTVQIIKDYYHTKYPKASFKWKENIKLKVLK